MTFPRLLEDNPVRADAFTGKSHERIARALVKLLVGTDAHRAIGVEGGWGSGKSTVIEIAKTLLQKEHDEGPDYKVFTFDAWAHHGDDFKRAFLEEMLTWFETQGLLGSKPVKKFRMELRARKRETTTKTRPELTLTGLVLAIVAPLLPIAYLWLGPLGFNNVAPKEASIFGAAVPSDLVLFAFLLVLLAPYFALLARTIWKRGDLAGAAVLLTGRHNTELSTQTVRDTDPTAVEFNQFLEKVVAAAHRDTSKLVVVIDNIDRLPKKRMEECWAEMRNLVAFAGQTGPHWGRVRIIVPYDPAHIVISAAAGGEDGETDTHLKDGALQKIFQARVAVAPPMIAHWKAFLEEKLNEAFGVGVPETAVRYRLAKVYELKLARGHAAATPRDIISFVNQLVSVALQWGDAIPLDCAGLFIVYKGKIKRPTQQLGKGELLDDKAKLWFESESWQRFLAALYFNVDPKDADQVLLRTEISKLLEEGDAATLKTFAAANPGFYPVLEEMIETEAMEWARQEPHKFAVSCETICTIADENPYFVDFFRHLATAAFNLGPVKKLVPEDMRKIALLIPKAGTLRGDELAYHLAGWIESMVSDIDAVSDGAAWIEALDEILASWKTMNGEGDAEPPARIAHRKIPKDARFIIEAAEAAGRLDHVDFSKLKVGVKSDEIAKLVVERAKAEAPVALAPIVNALVAADALGKPDPVVAAVAARLASGAPALTPETAFDLFAVIEKLDEGWTRGELKNLLNDGTLVYWFAAALNAKSWDFAARAFWRLKEEFGDGDPPNPGSHGAYGDLSAAFTAYTAFKNQGEGPEAFVDALCQILEAGRKFDEVFDHAVAKPQKPGWAPQTLRRLVDRARYDWLSPSAVFKKFDALKTVLGDERITTFVETFGGWEDSFAENLEGDRIYNCAASLIELSLRPEGESVKAIGEIVKTRLKSFDAEKWALALEKRNSDLSLLFLVLRNGGLELPGPSFRDPLRGHLLDILKGEAGSKFDSDWALLLNALASDTRKKLFADFMKEAGQTPVKADASLAFLKLFPTALDEAPLEDYPNAAVEAFLLPAFEAFSTEASILIQPRADRFKAALAASSPTTQGAFRESAEASWEKADAKKKDEIIALARSLGIEIEKAKPEAGEDERASDDSAADGEK